MPTIKTEEEEWGEAMEELNPGSFTLGEEDYMEVQNPRLKYLVTKVCGGLTPIFSPPASLASGSNSVETAVTGGALGPHPISKEAVEMEALQGAPEAAAKRLERPGHW